MTQLKVARTGRVHGQMDEDTTEDDMARLWQRCFHTSMLKCIFRDQRIYAQFGAVHTIQCGGRTYNHKVT